ncbi:MAG TPA: hypothetical protein VEU11_05845 [Terriglobales bacterium]|nr:hypothetical protein [Terriglobales bacterium]
MLLLTATLSVSLWAQTAHSQPRQAAASQPTSGPTAPHQQPQTRRPYQHREDFFHASTKLVNPKDFDYGAWIEERRRALLEASVANPFFWYSALTTGLVMLLMLMYGVRVLGEKRKLWHAAEILTDVWNQDQYSRAVAAAAVDKYNRHMEECNRAVEAQLSGRPSPTALEADDAKRQIENLRADLSATESAKNEAKTQLGKKDKLIAEMSARITALEKMWEENGGSPPAGTDTVTKLVARINTLQQQLEAERQRNRQVKGA